MEFISDHVYCIALKNRWRDIIVVNVRSSLKDNADYIKENFYEEIERLFDQLPAYHMKILLDDFNAKAGRENILQPTIGNRSVHSECNDNGIRLLNFPTSKNLIVESKKISHRNIYKYTWTLPNGITRNKIIHVLVDRGDSRV